MDRIQKALEKAHQQRQLESANKSQPLLKNQDTHLPPITEEISYQETQTLKVDKATLIKNRVVAAIKNDPRADIFRILRTKVLKRLRADNANVLAITSPTIGNGKSLIAANLAVSMAMDSNYSVLLVDLDLRRPSIDKYFGLSPHWGLSHYFEDNKPISELLINPGLEKLVILPAGNPMMNSSELLSTPKMLSLTTELKHRYSNRIVIIDLPPILLTDDAMGFMPHADACILVVAEGMNTKDEVERSMQLIEQKKYVGAILNKSADAGNSEYYY